MTRAILTGLALVSLSPILGEATSISMRCSVVPFSGLRSSQLTYFIGTATSDTVEAGPGSVQFNLEEGHSGRPQPRTIYGQVVRAERIGGAHADLLREHFARSSSPEVVLVPWDYDAGCDRSLWPQSAHWIEPGQPGFFTVELRPREHWVGERPTFDAFMAAMEPYPHAAFYRYGYGGTDALRSTPSLTVEEYYALYEAMPDWREFDIAPRKSTEALWRWKRENPSLASKYPATKILESIKYFLEDT